MTRSIIPWKERLPYTFPRLEHEMENMMEKFFGDGGARGIAQFAPSLNISESDQEYSVTAELPGLKPDEVNVEIREGSLCISGVKQSETEEKGKTYHRMERSHGEFRRVVQLPSAVEEEKVEAKFENGVLTVTLPKCKEAKPKSIKVKS